MSSSGDYVTALPEGNRHMYVRFVSLKAVEALQGYSNHHECIGNLRGGGGGRMVQR